MHWMFILILVVIYWWLTLLNCIFIIVPSRWVHMPSLPQDARIQCRIRHRTAWKNSQDTFLRGADTDRVKLQEFFFITPAIFPFMYRTNYSLYIYIYIYIYVCVCVYVYVCVCVYILERCVDVCVTIITESRHYNPRCIEKENNKHWVNTFSGI